jgi:small-conductance mechanosensitive channel
MDSLAAYAADLRDALGEVPDFILPVALVLLAVVLALVAHWLAFRLLHRVMDTKVNFAALLLHRARRPLRLAFILMGLIIVLPRVSLPWNWDGVLQHLAMILLIILLGWTVLLLSNLYSERSVSRYRFDTDDNLAARKYVTQVRVLRRAVNIVVVIFTVAAVLLTFEGVQRYGVSLFASAGAAGLVLGLAARPVLANLIAGVQIAITQPIRLEDVVIVEGEWGWVEEIFATYVVVRLWDWRRMVVPLSYFIEKPFQNWTRETASVIGSVYWYLDYTVPVAELRRKLEELVTASPYWDGQVVNLQVTDTDKDTITLRGLMSARTSPQAWDLRCEIREKLIGWLQTEYPGALPRLRWEAAEGAGGAVTAPVPQSRPQNGSSSGT